jgi:hypothetical protein
VLRPKAQETTTSQSIEKKTRSQYQLARPLKLMNDHNLTMKFYETSFPVTLQEGEVHSQTVSYIYFIESWVGYDTTRYNFLA